MLEFWYLRCVRVIILLLILESYAAHGQDCDEDSWKCRNGQCIQDHELCDGEINCSDGSDETTAACIAIHCPQYAYRCAYGACVTGKAECNGRKDCADNSDELTLRCTGALSNGNCTADEFKCDSGQCISIQNACDGTIECEDKSDETVRKCQSTYCPSYGFRCGYGACVHGKLKCDGDRDCADGSDEDRMLCGEPPTSAPHTPATPSMVFPSESSQCTADLNPNVKAYFEATPDTEIKNGAYVESFASIIYKCKANHKLIGISSNFCTEDGTWSNDAPYCQKYCSSLSLSGATIKVSCEYRKFTISCREPLMPKTIARITCEFGYEKPKRHVNDVLVCLDDGEWDYPVFRCEQICGIEAPEGVAYIVGGELANNTKVPWHVGIYNDVRARGQYTQSCGGTIVNANVIISAAHCFWDRTENRFYNASHFMVGIGKYYRDYNAQEPLAIQKIQVSEILHQEGYDDYAGLFNADIVLLVLSEFIIFKSYVIPICIEYNLSYNDKYIPAGWVGRVAGWGLTKSGGSSSAELKVLDLPSIEYNTCRAESTPEYRRFITSDKFCAGYTTGKSVCQGDSGGGLGFPKNFSGVKVFYLRGIVSSGANKNLSCDSDKYTTFTNIQYYIDLILQVVTQFSSN